MQKEREKILEYKRQVQNLVNKSKKIVQLKPRNPDYRSNKPIILRALCDYKQDQVCTIQKLSLLLHMNFCQSREQNLMEVSVSTVVNVFSFVYKAASCWKKCSSFVLNHMIVVNNYGRFFSILKLV